MGDTAVKNACNATVHDNLPIDLSRAVLTLEQTTFAYTGEEIKPVPIVTLKGEVISSD